MMLMWKRGADATGGKPPAGSKRLLHRQRIFPQSHRAEAAVEERSAAGVGVEGRGGVEKVVDPELHRDPVEQPVPAPILAKGIAGENIVVHLRGDGVAALRRRIRDD